MPVRNNIESEDACKSFYQKTSNKHWGPYA